MDDKIVIKLQNLQKLLLNPDLLTKPLDPRDREYIEKKISYVTSEIKKQKKTTPPPSLPTDKFSIDVVDSSASYAKDYYELIKFVKSKYLTNIDTHTEYVYYQDQEKQRQLLSAKYGYKWKDLVGRARIKTITEEMQSLTAEKDEIKQELSENQKRYSVIIQNIRTHVQNVNQLINSQLDNMDDVIFDETNIENTLLALQTKLQTKGYIPNFQQRQDNIKTYIETIEQLIQVLRQRQAQITNLTRENETLRRVAPEIGRMARSREDLADQRNNLAEQNAQLEAESVLHAQTIQNLRREIDDLTNNNIQLLREIGIHIQRNLANEDIMRQQANEMNDMRSHNNRQIAIIRQLQEEMRQKIAEQQRLSNEYKNSNTQNRSLLEKIQSTEQEKKQQLTRIQQLLEEQKQREEANTREKTQLSGRIQQLLEEQKERENINENIKQKLSAVDELNKKLQSELRESKKLSEEKEQKIQQLTIALTNCERTLQQLSGFYSTLKQILQITEDEQKGIDPEKLNQLITDLLKKQKNHEKTISDLQSELQKKHLLMEELEQKSSREIGEKNTKIDDLKSEIQTLRDTLQEVEDRNEEEIQNLIDESKEKLQVAEEAYNAETKRQDGLIKQIHDKNSDLANELAHVYPKALMQARAETHETMLLLLRENDELIAEKKQLIDSLEKSAIELGQLKNTLEDYKQQNNDLQLTLDQDRQIFQRGKEELSRLIQQLREEKDAIERETTARIIRGKDEEMKKLNGENRDLTSELNRVREELKQKSEERNRLHALNLKLLNEVKRIKSENTALTARHSDIIQQLEECRRQLLDCQRQNQILTNENKNLTDQLRGKLDENKHLQEENSRLTQQLQQLNQQIYNMEREIQRLQQRENDIPVDVINNDEYKGLMAEKNQLARELENCRKELEDQQNIFQNLQTQNSKTQRINEELVRRIGRCSENFRILMSKIIQFLNDHDMKNLGDELKQIDPIQTEPQITQDKINRIYEAFNDIINRIKRDNPQCDEKTTENIEIHLNNLRQIMSYIHTNQISNLIEVMLYLTALYKGLQPIYLSLNLVKDNDGLIETYLNHIIANIVPKSLENGGLIALFSYIPPPEEKNIISIIDSELGEYQKNLRDIKDERPLQKINRLLITILIDVLNKIKQIKDNIADYQEPVIENVIPWNDILSNIRDLMEELGSANDNLRRQIASLEEKNTELIAEAKDVIELRRINDELEGRIRYCESEFTNFRMKYDKKINEELIDKIYSILISFHANLIKNQYHDKPEDATDLILELANLLPAIDNRGVARDIINQVRTAIEKKNPRDPTKTGGYTPTPPPISINEFWKYGTYTLLLAIVILLIVYMIQLITRMNKKIQYPIIQEPIYIEC